MNDKIALFLGLIVGSIIYAPIGMYLFDVSISTMLERTYFALCGAAFALFAYRA